jgi:signal peptidase I
MKLVKTAYIVAFVTAGLILIQSFMVAIITIPLALIPLIAGIGIMRRRVWSAYGYALFQCAQLLLLPVLLLRGGRVLSVAPFVGAIALSVGLSVLFFLAGRSLQAAGCKRGLATPWIAISAICIVPLIFVQAFVIPSAAMAPTLIVGDRVLVQRLPKPKPSRDGIIVFRYPLDRRQSYVKRVIGMPGDHIRISDKVVYRNGAPLNEAYAVHLSTYFDSYRDNFPNVPTSQLPSQALEMLAKHVVDGEIVVPGKN